MEGGGGKWESSPLLALTKMLDVLPRFGGVGLETNGFFECSERIGVIFHSVEGDAKVDPRKSVIWITEESAFQELLGTLVMALDCVTYGKGLEGVDGDCTGEDWRHLRGAIQTQQHFSKRNTRRFVAWGTQKIPAVQPNRLLVGIPNVYDCQA